MCKPRLPTREEWECVLSVNGNQTRLVFTRSLCFKLVSVVNDTGSDIQPSPRADGNPNTPQRGSRARCWPTGLYLASVTSHGYESLKDQSWFGRLRKNRLNSCSVATIFVCFMEENVAKPQCKKTPAIVKVQNFYWFPVSPTSEHPAQKMKKQQEAKKWKGKKKGALMAKKPRWPLCASTSKQRSLIVVESNICGHVVVHNLSPAFSDRCDRLKTGTRSSRT